MRLLPRFQKPKLIARRVFRLRRRLLIVTSLAFVAGVILYLNVPGNKIVFGLPLPLFTGLTYGVLVGFAALVTGLLLPNLRFAIEAIAVSRLLLAILTFFVPEIGSKLMNSPLANATIVIGGAYLLQHLFFGDWSRRLFNKQNHTARIVLHSKLSSAVLTQAIQYTQITDAITTVDHRLHGSDNNRSVPEIQGIQIADNGAEREVIFDLHYTKRPLFAILAYWIDDTNGRVCDQLMSPLSAPQLAKVF